MQNYRGVSIEDNKLYCSKFLCIISDKLAIIENNKSFRRTIYMLCMLMTMVDSPEDKRKIKKKSVKSLAKMWNTLKHGPKDNKGHFNPKKNMADSTKCINGRYYKGAKKVCSAILNQIYNNNGHKKATKEAFEGVKYYQTVAKVKKIKKSASKKNYLINSYGILNLNKYLSPGKNKKLKKTVDNMSNKNVKGVVSA